MVAGVVSASLGRLLLLDTDHDCRPDTNFILPSMGPTWLGRNDKGDSTRMNLTKFLLLIPVLLVLSGCVGAYESPVKACAKYYRMKEKPCSLGWTGWERDLTLCLELGRRYNRCIEEAKF